MKFRNIYQKELICPLWQGDSSSGLCISPRVHLEGVSFPEIPLSFMIAKDPRPAPAIRTPAPEWPHLPISMLIMPRQAIRIPGSPLRNEQEKRLERGTRQFLFFMNWTAMNIPERVRMLTAMVGNSGTGIMGSSTPRVAPLDVTDPHELVIFTS